MNNFIFLIGFWELWQKVRKLNCFVKVHSNEKILYFLRQMIGKRSFQQREYNKKYFLKKYISSFMFDFVDDGKVCTY